MRLRLTHLAHPLPMLLGVGMLAAGVTTSATLVHVDATLGRVLRSAASEIPAHAGFALSALGSTDLVMPVTAAAVLVLCVLRHWRGAATLTLAVLATQAVVEVIKLAVERPRPAMNDAIADASGYSFPSAHSATSAALYATLALLAAGACRGGTRVAIAATGLAVVAAIGLSRVLLAAHYPSDVLAGWLTGGALVAGSWLLVRQLVAALPRPQLA